MTVVVDMTVSLDGFVTAPGAGPDAGLGEEGLPLHDWALQGDDVDRDVLDRAMAATGAVVMGRKTFDVVDGPHGWDETRGYGAGSAPTDQPPCFVVTSHHPDHVRLTDRMTIVTDGLESAIDQAEAAAGDRGVYVMGGGALCSSVLRAGLADELVLHVAPLVLGDGTPFWDDVPRTSLELLDSVVTPNAAHLRYSVR